MSVSEVDEARDPSTDPARLAELSASVDNAVRRGVAMNSSTPGEVLMRLAEDSDFVREGVALNSSTPVEVLARLADDPGSTVRQQIKRHPTVRGLQKEAEVSTDEARLSELASSQFPSVLTSVAHNPSAPVELLTRLSEDSDWGVRRGVAGNSSTPVEALMRLAEDSDSGVRRGVAGNSSTPVEVLMRLAEDSDSGVRRWVVTNPSTPVEVLMRLAEDSDSGVRQGVAGNSSTPGEVLMRLAEDSDFGVREAAEENPSTPAELLPEIDRRRFSRVHELIPNPGEWVFYRHVEEEESEYGFFEAEVTSAVAWDTRDWWFDDLDLQLAERITGEYAELDIYNSITSADEAALLPVSHGPPDWYLPLASPRADPLLNHDWKLLVSQEAAAEDLVALVQLSESVFPGSDLVSAVVARHPNSPPELLSRLAAGDDDEIRWLLTRNPGASDTVKAAAVLTGVKEPWSFKYGDEEDDHDGEASDDQASFSRNIQVSFEGSVVVWISRWADRTLTSADVADFVFYNVLDDEQFKDWADEHRDAHGRISTEDFTEWLKEYALEIGDNDGLEWLNERFSLGHSDDFDVQTDGRRRV